MVGGYRRAWGTCMQGCTPAGVDVRRGLPRPGRNLHAELFELFEVFELKLFEVYELELLTMFELGLLEK